MNTFLAANEERIRKRAEHREALQAAANTCASAETRNAQSAADMLFDELKVFFPTFRWVASVSGLFGCRLRTLRLILLSYQYNSSNN